jgi:hypothetical protein
MDESISPVLDRQNDFSDLFASFHHGMRVASLGQREGCMDNRLDFPGFK